MGNISINHVGHSFIFSWSFTHTLVAEQVCVLLMRRHCMELSHSVSRCTTPHYVSQNSLLTQSANKNADIDQALKS